MLKWVRIGLALFTAFVASGQFLFPSDNPLAPSFSDTAYYWFLILPVPVWGIVVNLALAAMYNQWATGGGLKRFAILLLALTGLAASGYYTFIVGGTLLGMTDKWWWFMFGSMFIQSFWAGYRLLYPPEHHGHDDHHDDHKHGLWSKFTGLFRKGDHDDDHDTPKPAKTAKTPKKSSKKTDDGELW